MRKGSCVLLHDPNYNVLMVTRPDGRGFGLPGGKLEEGESFEDAALRELWEETGIVAAPTALIHLHRGVCVDDNPEGEHFDVSTFLVVEWGGRLQHKEEAVRPLWGRYQVLLDQSPFAAYNAAVAHGLVNKTPNAQKHLGDYQRLLRSGFGL